MWRLFVVFLAIPWPRLCWADERLVEQQIASNFLKSSRTVHIYLPASYQKAPNRRYPVLYVHDGQNLFTAAGTNICFGWGNWQLDKTVDELGAAGRIQELILVGVDNSSARYSEYCGRHHSQNVSTNTPFENYAGFLVHELKPMIDSHYRTLPEPKNTGVMGSSLGGICSIVLAWDYPEIFGKAASLSGSFQVDATNFLNAVLRPYPGKSKPIRLYLDSGVVDFTGGDDGRSMTAAVSEEFRRMGWTSELMTYVDEKPMTVAELENTGFRRDKWAEAQTSQHNELYWRSRVWRALEFLFPAQDDARKQ